MAYRAFDIPVQGGTLQLGVTTVDVNDELLPDLPAALLVYSLRFEYTGTLPREMALDLVRRSPDDGVRINGKTVLEFLESFGADQR